MKTGALTALLFAALAAVALVLGFDRSGWIHLTYPVEASHSANTLLGYSYVRGGSLFHLENHSALLQVGLFSGANITPDLYFRRPIYPFLAAALAPAMGVVGSLVAINLLAWGFAAWLCRRFATAFYGDEQAGAWAGLLAVAGIGFALHSLDLSAHLVSFVLYMGGVVLMYELGIGRRSVEPRSHAAIAAFLMLACMQYNTGIALVASYAALAIWRNPIRIVLPVVVAAVLAQPSWGAILGALHQARHGLPLADLSATEVEYLQRALKGWAAIFSQPAPAMFASVGRITSSFLWFEMPLVVAIGTGKLLWDSLSAGEGRSRLAFALPFIVFPLMAAMVFANAASARGYLVYGIAIFFFAACGAVIARLVRAHAAAGRALGALIVSLTLIWGCAHFFGVLGPSKAYFLGMQSASHLFERHEAASMTGAEPTPRAFGGNASLAQGGLAPDLPTAPNPGDFRFLYSAGACALPAALVALFIGFATRRWVAASLLGTLLLLSPALLGRFADYGPLVASPRNIMRLGPGAAVTYEIKLSREIRQRLAEGLRQGHVAVLLFPGFYGTDAAPRVRIGGQEVALARRLNWANWLLDGKALVERLESAQGEVFEVFLSSPQETWTSAWQRIGLPGRRVTGAAPDAHALPAVEIRLLRDADTMAPVLIAY